MPESQPNNGGSEAAVREWVPNAYYSASLDEVIAHFEPVSYYAKWINPHITLLLAQDDNRIVGAEIGGVKRMVSEPEVMFPEQPPLTDAEVMDAMLKMGFRPVHDEEPSNSPLNSPPHLVD